MQRLALTLRALQIIFNLVGRFRKARAQSGPARAQSGPARAQSGPARARPLHTRREPPARRLPRQASPQTPTRPTGRARPLRYAQLAFASALGAAAGAYVVKRERERQFTRLTPIDQPFAVELLDVLGAPGTGQSLQLASGALHAAHDGSTYAVVDGIPDFVGGGVPSGVRTPLDQVYHNGGLFLNTLESVSERLIWPAIWGVDRLPLGSLAGATIAGAGTGWCLSVPCGAGTYELEMARANPAARIVCLDSHWGLLLEARLRALEAGVTNLYFVRGDIERLPLQRDAFAAVWTCKGFHSASDPALTMRELTRVAVRGALVAGASLVRGGPRHTAWLLHRFPQRWPGACDSLTHLTHLSAAGLHQLRVARNGGLLQFRGVRA